MPRRDLKPKSGRIIAQNDSGPNGPSSSSSSKPNKAKDVPKSGSADSEGAEESSMSYVWDSLDLDLFIKVAQMSILSPLFAIWVPILTLAQGFPSDSFQFTSSLYYLYFTFIVSTLNLSSKVWLNRSWKWGLGGVFSARRTDWGEEVVVITGGSRGLGRTITETMGTRNVSVAVLDVMADESMSGKEWDDVHYYKCDVSDRAQVMAAAERIKKDLGEPTILINNAGIVKGKSMLDLTEEDVRRTFDVNTLAHFWTIQAFLPGMIKNERGHIVTVSSVLGDIGVPALSDYCASKAALNSMHESLRYEIKTKYPHLSTSLRLTLLHLGHLRGTPLFSSIARPTALLGLGGFLAPQVDPHNVAKQVIQALDCMESREICTPWYGNWTWVVKGLPSWARDGARWLANADHAMDTYKPVPEALDKKSE